MIKVAKKYGSVTEKAYAKINLHLDVTGRLEGGYHAVSTVMQTVSLCDIVTLSNISISENESRFTLECNVEGVPTDERNLAVKAALLFCEAVGMHICAHVKIEKNIPMAAGMAGGSADGAAVLRGLNRALGEPLTADKLCEIGSKLGADVPFCIIGGTAYADGRGDVLHSFPKMPDCVILASCEGEGVSTPWAYRMLDERYDGFEENSSYIPRSVENLRAALEDNDLTKMASSLYNIFEEPVLSQRPIAKEVKDIMTEGGALCAMMSGSGPSVFSVFEDAACADKVTKLLRARGYGAYICRPV